MSHANVSNAISFTEKETGFRMHSLALCHTALEGQFLQTALVFYLMGPLSFEGIGAKVPRLQSSHGPASLAAQRWGDSGLPWGFPRPAWGVRARCRAMATTDHGAAAL